ncbi:MAG TPA: hypothetical protein VJH03_05695 [Blastocatellia bacterium]|nr:hypothetical protein [Blastocatellia bacterium]
MRKQLRLEIKGKDGFWEGAFRVEWNAKFPGRRLIDDGGGHIMVESEWMGDLDRVAEQTFCKLIRAPNNPHRRQWIRSLVRRGLQ